jgi:hypothetical protein
MAKRDGKEEGSMIRPAVVVCLIVAMLGNGCASFRQKVQDSPEDLGLSYCLEPVNKWLCDTEWWDRHPVAKGAGYCVIGAALGAAIAGGVLLYLVWNGQDNQSPINGLAAPRKPRL